MQKKDDQASQPEPVTSSQKPPGVPKAGAASASEPPHLAGANTPAPGGSTPKKITPAAVWNPLADQIAFHCPDAIGLKLVYLGHNSYAVKHGARTLATYRSVGLAESDLRNAGFKPTGLTLDAMQVWTRAPKGVSAQDGGADA